MYIFVWVGEKYRNAAAPHTISREQKYISAYRSRLLARMEFGIFLCAQFSNMEITIVVFIPVDNECHVKPFG